MQIGELFKYNPQKDLKAVLAIFVMGTVMNGIADLFRDSFLFVLFYQGIFALGILIALPIGYVCRKEREPLSSIGINEQHWLRAILIGVLFVLVSVPGRIIGKGLLFPPSSLLLSTSLALLFACFFEEVFFRGILQTRIEQSFGVIPAIVLSGLTFSLYHLGYANYRSLGTLLTLWIVGMFFALTFQVTKNVITSIIVNFCHAVITFVNANNFFDTRSGVISLMATIVGIGLIFLIGKRKQVEGRSQERN